MTEALTALTLPMALVAVAMTVIQVATKVTNLVSIAVWQCHQHLSEVVVLT